VSLSVPSTIDRLATLVSGLLASGHYTSTENDGADSSKLLDYDAGKNWKDDGYQRRFQRLVIDEAEALLDDIIKLAHQREEFERLRRHGS
jgi:hypothetical protein